MMLGTTTIVNIGRLFTGELSSPVSDATELEITDGRISRIGAGERRRGRTIDARGMTVAPALIDSHSHVTFGDYTPRQNTVGFLANYVHGGTGQVVSAGEIHIPNRPQDPEGIIMLAKLAQRSWSGHRPGGMKVNAGVILLGPGLTPEHFRDAAEYGVRLAKYGFGVYRDLGEARAHVAAAQAVGITVVAHSGGPTAHDGVPVGADALIQLLPDVAGHFNGGTTSLRDSDLSRVIRETGMRLQLVQAGNLRSALVVLDEVRAAGAESRVILGTDTPTATGVMPLGMLKTIAELSSLGHVDPATTWAWASGSVADTFGLEGGRVAVGQPADLCVVDAPLGSYGDDAHGAIARGDVPAVVLVMIDGDIHVNVSNYSPRSRMAVQIEEG